MDDTIPVNVIPCWNRICFSCDYRCWFFSRSIRRFGGLSRCRCRFGGFRRLICRLFCGFRRRTVCRCRRSLILIVSLAGLFVNRVDKFALQIAFGSFIVNLCPYFSVCIFFVLDHPYILITRDCQTVLNPFRVLFWFGTEIDFVARYAITIQNFFYRKLFRVFRNSSRSRCGFLLRSRFFSRLCCGFFCRFSGWCLSLFICRFSGRLFCGYYCGIHRSRSCHCNVVCIAFCFADDIDKVAAQVSFFPVVKHLGPAIAVFSGFIGNDVDIFPGLYNTFFLQFLTWCLSKVDVLISNAVLVDEFSKRQFVGLLCLFWFISRFRSGLSRRLCGWFSCR